MKFFLLAGLW